MKRESYKEEFVYSKNEQNLDEKTQTIIRNTIKNNSAIGFIAGYYDDPLTIVYVSEFFLHNLNYDYDTFMQVTNGSLKNLIYGENNTFLRKDHFKDIHGQGEGQILSQEGIILDVHFYKEDSEDVEGEPIWILSACVNETQENLNLVSQIIQAGFWSIECDTQGKPESIRYSHEFRRMLGYHDIYDFPDQIDTWVDILHPDDKDQALDQLDEFIYDHKNQKKYEIEYRMKTKDGSYHWFRDQASMKRRKDGTAFHLVGIIINIDHEKEMEKLHRRYNAFHRAYTKSNLCELYVDLKNNHFDSLKEAHVSTTMTWDQLVQTYIDKYGVTEEKETLHKIYDRQYLLEIFSNGQTEINYESKIVYNGETRWLRHIILRDENPNYAMVMIRDITKSKIELENINTITKQNEAMDMLIQGTVKLVDRYAMCNLENNTYQFFSHLDNDSIYLPNGNFDQFTKDMAKFYKTVDFNTTLVKEISIENIRSKLKKDSDIFRIEYCSLDETQYKTIAITPISWKNGIVEKVLLLAQDATQEKQIEIQSRKALQEAFDDVNKASKAKTQFLSNMSHDIRTPMNAIVGMTAIAGANIDNRERVLDCLTKITKSSRHLLGLINEVLDMSRIESGKISLNDEEFNLSELVENVLSLIKSDVRSHEHQFNVKINNIEHEDVCGDSLRIQQLLLNILTNAIKYTPDHGEIDFIINEIPTNSSKLGCYEFIVKDNGIGMSENFQKVMFDPFTRADENRATQIQGTGLGLAIAKNIAKMMHGSIDVVSTINHGSKFTITIYLPLQDKEMDKIDEFIDLPVLVVDDDIISCETTVSILKDIGIDGEWVISGKEAIDQVKVKHNQNHDYFAIIIDWKMPEMDGIETTKRIRKIVGKEVTIIILSAYDYSVIEKEARDAGVDEFIAKPLFRSRLAATLKHAVEGKAHSSKSTLEKLNQLDYSNKRILLVEDNELNSEIAKEIIGMTGAKIDVAQNGKEAVDIFSQAPDYYYDLIFMDIQMPILNGYEATAAIRSLPKHGAKTIPIIAMTANAFSEDIALSKISGMNEHIAKPLDLQKLKTVLEKWIR